MFAPFAAAGGAAGGAAFDMPLCNLVPPFLLRCRPALDLPTLAAAEFSVHVVATTHEVREAVAMGRH